ncbi:IS630 family transposase [Deinococcus radiopugnans ATCC 19172]|uniref:IS630 family transposase n=1 Tax=Deinococcus radiopugnans ATCC 19172 TaxID=585398 RepID=A0A5C4XUW6_9DEIO|nr:IS630 family transposase [Deinococcus radiopugnans ATCC 19172]
MLRVSGRGGVQPSDSPASTCRGRSHRPGRVQKKVLPEAVRATHTRAEGTGRAVEVWCMDEHRLGLKPIVGKMWAERGKAPTVAVEHRYAWLYVYAFVCPQTGESQYWLVPSVDTLAFQAVLDRFARDTGAGQRREIVLVLDGAGWHCGPQLTCPEGLHPVFLPPYSPELQPAERLWALTDMPLRNCHFPALDALTERLAAQCRWLEG